MFRRICLLNLVFTLLLFGISQALEIVFTDVVSTILDPDVVEKSDMKIVEHNGRNTLNGSFSFKVPLDNVNFNFVLDFVKDGKTILRPLNVDLEGCKFLNSAYDSQPLAKSILKSLIDSPNFPKKCPVEAHKEITMEYFDIKLIQIPSYLPGVNFEALTTLSTNKKKFLQTLVKGYTK